MYWEKLKGEIPLEKLRAELFDGFGDALQTISTVLFPVSPTRAMLARETAPKADPNSANRTLIADQEAMAVALIKLDRLLQWLADLIGCQAPHYIVEEGSFRQFLFDNVPAITKRVANLKKTAVSEVLEKPLVAVLDPLDGSLPFSMLNPGLLGIGLPPLFASGLCLFIEGVYRASCLWIPQPDITQGSFIFTSLEGPAHDPTTPSYATLRRRDYPERNLKDEYLSSPRLSKRSDQISAIVGHLSRTDWEGRSLAVSVLEDKALAGASVFNLNAGLLGMLSVPLNNTVFVNPATHLWDICAGLPLLASLNCPCTDWLGNKLDLRHYSQDNRLSIVASGSPAQHERIIQITRKIMLDRAASTA